MIKYAFFLISLYICSIPRPAKSYGKDYRGLLETMVKTPEIIGRSPLKEFKLSIEDAEYYEYYLDGQGKPKIDRSLLDQLIKKSMAPDTTAWADDDFNHSLFVCSPHINLNADSALSALRTLGGAKIEQYKQLIDQFNASSLDDYSSNPRRAKVSYYSRPVFDASGEYSIIAYYFPKENSGVALFRFSGNEWKYYGNLYSVAY
jgi:hypothetical protein